MKLIGTLTSLFQQPAWQARPPLRKLNLVLMLATGFFAPVSIAASQALAAAAGICWLLTLPGGWRKVRASSFLVPMTLFVLFSALTIAFSQSPLESLWNARNLLIFLVVPVVIHTIRGELELKMMLFAMGFGAIFTVIWGSIEILMGQGGGTHGMRLAGTLGHYMTAGGVLMFVALALLAALFHSSNRRSRLFYGLASALVAVGVALTQSRNAYVGLFTGIIAILLLWRREMLAVLPFALSLAVLLAPPMVRERVLRIVDFEDQSVLSRMYMLQTGAAMVADFPLFGIGMVQVEKFYNYYKHEDDPGDVPHLHNNIAQIAAERGLVALALWIWMIWSIGLGQLRLMRRPNAPPWYRMAAMAGFAVLVSMFFAGMFEYNFGDAEVKMAFLILVMLPFGLRKRNSMVVPE